MDRIGVGLGTDKAFCTRDVRGAGRTYLPAAYCLIEYFGVTKHAAQYRHVGHVPVADILIEHARAMEHTVHSGYIGHIPLADIVVEVVFVFKELKRQDRVE